MKENMMKAFTLALLIFTAGVQVGAAASPVVAPDRGLVVRVDWQEPQFLPRRFRNHCSIENFTGRPFCADHCGSDSQFFYCSEGSFGCCHLGRGYCDFDGLLRCSP
jgi:hypothetical protein